MPEPQPKKKKPWRMWLLIAIASLVVLVPLLGLLLLLSSFRVPSGSMMPTLVTGEILLPTGTSGTPSRGDVIIFPFPENPQQYFIKRVVGLPGDTIEFVGGRPIINGWLVPHCHVGSISYEGRSQELYLEYLGDRTYGVLREVEREVAREEQLPDWMQDVLHKDKVAPEEQPCKVDADCETGMGCRAKICGNVHGPWRVPSGEVWMVGDNRNNSHDSRFWRGGQGAGVPIDTIKKRAWLLWMSFDKGGAFARDRTWTRVDGPPVLPPSAAALKPALDQCLKARPAETEPPPAR